MLRPLAALVLMFGCGACLAASPDQPSFTMYYHWDSGLRAAHLITVEIMSDGRASCEIVNPLYARRASRSELDLTPEEVAYFESLFRRVMALDRRAVEVSPFPGRAGISIWRMTEDGETRKLSYSRTDNPWATDLEQAVRRFSARQFALARLAQDDPKARYNAAYDVLSDLKQRKIFRPEDLHAPLLVAARKWPAPGLSLDHTRDTIANLLHALAYCAPPEQWVGDVMELYGRQPHESRAIMLRAIAESNLLSELEGDRGRMLVPLMIAGLTEMLDDPALPEGGNEWHAALNLINALGNLRDARALDVLNSDRLWEIQDRRPLMDAAAGALPRIGLPGVRALVGRTSSDCLLVRRTAQAELAYAPQTYAFPSGLLPRESDPTLDQMDDVRDFLVERGLCPEGIDAFDIPDAAAKALHQSYPDWRYILSFEFSAPALHGLHEWEYDPRKRGPQRCRLDYDGNGLEDIALLIRRDYDLKLVLLLQTGEGRWTTEELTSFPLEAARDRPHRSLVVSIAPAPPQTLILPGSPSGGNSITLDTPGIALHRVGEPATTVFYWYWAGGSAAPDTASP